MKNTIIKRLIVVGITLTFCTNMYAAYPPNYEELKAAGGRFFTNSHEIEVGGKKITAPACSKCHSSPFTDKRLASITSMNYDGALAKLTTLKNQGFPLFEGSPVTFKAIPDNVISALAAYLAKPPGVTGSQKSN